MEESLIEISSKRVFPNEFRNVSHCLLDKKKKKTGRCVIRPMARVPKV
jgi:hypothetical protein